MVKNGDIINFKTVARKANVTTAWLYRNKDLRTEIEKLRLEKNVGLPNEKITQTKNDLISKLSQQVKKLKKENAELKKQIEIIYGKLFVTRDEFLTKSMDP